MLLPEVSASQLWSPPGSRVKVSREELEQASALPFSSFIRQQPGKGLRRPSPPTQHPTGADPALVQARE